MNFLETKAEIIRTLTNDCKCVDDLVGMTAWALSKAKRLAQELEEQDENDLNAFENQTFEG
jgi:hypothetical protein